MKLQKLTSPVPTASAVRTAKIHAEGGHTTGVNSNTMTHSHSKQCMQHGQRVA